MTERKNYDHPDAARERANIDEALLAFTEELRATLYEKAAERGWCSVWSDSGWSAADMAAELQDRVSRGHPIYAACYLLFLHSKENRAPLDPAYDDTMRSAYRWSDWRRVPLHGGYAFAVGIHSLLCPWPNPHPERYEWMRQWHEAFSARHTSRTKGS